MTDDMTKNEFDEMVAVAAKKYAGGKRVALRAETQFRKGAEWLWGVLMAAHDVNYYEEVLRAELTDRIGGVEPWKGSLIHDTAVMMADRDGMLADIQREGRLLTKYDKNENMYKESNPLYVHLKEKERSIGLQREHLGLSNKSNPERIKQDARKGVDAEHEGMSRLLRSAREAMEMRADELD